MMPIQLPLMIRGTGLFLQTKMQQQSLDLHFLCTFPETNMAPENRPSQKETGIPTIQFRCYVSFRKCITHILEEQLFFQKDPSIDSFLRVMAPIWWYSKGPLLPANQAISPETIGFCKCNPQFQCFRSSNIYSRSSLTGTLHTYICLILSVNQDPKSQSIIISFQPT